MLYGLLNLDYGWILVAVKKSDNLNMKVKLQTLLTPLAAC